MLTLLTFLGICFGIPWFALYPTVFFTDDKQMHDQSCMHVYDQGKPSSLQNLKCRSHRLRRSRRSQNIMVWKTMRKPSLWWHPTRPCCLMWIFVSYLRWGCLGEQNHVWSCGLCVIVSLQACQQSPVPTQLQQALVPTLAPSQMLYLLGLLAMIKCSICSCQCDNWYVSNWRLACHINFCWGSVFLAQVPGTGAGHCTAILYNVII